MFQSNTLFCRINLLDLNQLIVVSKKVYLPSTYWTKQNVYLKNFQRKFHSKKIWQMIYAQGQDSYVQRYNFSNFEKNQNFIFLFAKKFGSLKHFFLESNIDFFQTYLCNFTDKLYVLSPSREMWCTRVNYTSDEKDKKEIGNLSLRNKNYLIRVIWTITSEIQIFAFPLKYTCIIKEDIKEKKGKM